MKDTKLLPNDARLTAYALGELSGDERAAFEVVLRNQPELRSTVEAIRATARQLEAALASEAAEATAAEEIVRVIHVDGHPQLVTPARRPPVPGTPPKRERTPASEYGRRRRAKLLRFPQFYYVVGGLAAAGFAVMVFLYRDAYEAKQQARIAQQKQRDAEARVATVRHVVPVRLVPFEESSGRDNSPMTTAGLAVTAPADRLGDAAGTGEAVGPVRPAAAPAFIDGTLTLSEPARPATTTAPAVENRTMVPPPERAPANVAATEHAATPLPSAATPPAPAPVAEPRRLESFTVSAPRETSARPPVPGLAVKQGLPPPTSELAPQFAHNTESYSYIKDNDFLPAETNRLSTFAIDVDTASYTNVRRIIEYGTLPPRDAVRVEELLNYFPYHYPAPPPKDGAPFAASLEVAEAPWAPLHRLVRIGLKAREVTTAERGPANLVFLIDVSGSMSAPNKLPLVKESLRLLLAKLRRDDRVAIVTYAGSSGLALASTPVARSAEIIRALDALAAGGSTNGGMGIQLAYDIAKANVAKDGINRVILCTDGDFNVGTTSEGELVRLIEEKSHSGVFLTVLGFGMGNLKDSTLEKLAHRGNGNYGYVDSRREAEKLLGEQVSSTLVAVAKDVKIQVEFNPAKVARYRLIGYENRVLKKEDFNSDNVDAGEIGAGHTVTALYEIVPVGADKKFPASPPVDDLKYQARSVVSTRLEMPMDPPKPPAVSEELLTVKVRYKKPDAFFSEKKEFALNDKGLRFDKASPDFRFAAAVAQFGMILRDSPYKGSATIGDVIAWAATAATSPSDDPGGYRGEFIDLARKAARMVQ